jgi:hypothetical protein
MDLPLSLERLVGLYEHYRQTLACLLHYMFGLKKNKPILDARIVKFTDDMETCKVEIMVLDSTHMDISVLSSLSIYIPPIFNILVFWDAIDCNIFSDITIAELTQNINTFVSQGVGYGRVARISKCHIFLNYDANCTVNPTLKQYEEMKNICDIHNICIENVSLDREVTKECENAYLKYPSSTTVIVFISSHNSYKESVCRFIQSGFFVLFAYTNNAEIVTQSKCTWTIAWDKIQSLSTMNKKKVLQILPVPMHFNDIIQDMFVKNGNDYIDSESKDPFSGHPTHSCLSYGYLNFRHVLIRAQPIGWLIYDEKLNKTVYRRTYIRSISCKDEHILNVISRYIISDWNSKHHFFAKEQLLHYDHMCAEIGYRTIRVRSCNPFLLEYFSKEWEQIIGNMVIFKITLPLSWKIYHVNALTNSIWLDAWMRVYKSIIHFSFQTDVDHTYIPRYSVDGSCRVTVCANIYSYSPIYEKRVRRLLQRLTPISFETVPTLFTTTLLLQTRKFLSAYILPIHNTCAQVYTFSIFKLNTENILQEWIQGNDVFIHINIPFQWETIMFVKHYLYVFQSYIRGRWNESCIDVSISSNILHITAKRYYLSTLLKYMYDVEDKIVSKFKIFTQVTSFEKNFFLKWKNTLKERECIIKQQCNPFSCMQKLIPIMIIDPNGTCRSGEIHDVKITMISLCEMNVKEEMKRMEDIFYTFTHKTVKCMDDCMFEHIQKNDWKKQFKEEHGLVDLSLDINQKSVQLWGEKQHVQSAIDFMTQYMYSFVHTKIRTKVMWPDARLRYSFFVSSHIHLFKHLYEKKIAIQRTRIQFATYNNIALILSGDTEDVKSVSQEAKNILTYICENIQHVVIYTNALQHQLFSVLSIKKIQKKCGVYIQKQQKYTDIVPSAVYNISHTKQVCNVPYLSFHIL